MKSIFILLLSLVTISLSQRSVIQFEIRKRHTNGDKSSRVGKLIVNIQQAYRSVEAQVVSDLNQLVSQQDFAGGHQAILQFTCVQSDLNQYKGRVYLTSVDQIISEPHGQKISIFLGPTQDHLSIISINYVHSRQRPGQIFTQVIDTKQAQDKIIKYEQDKTKTEAQNESFFSKYKWPLIIGGVLLYTTMTANPQAAARGSQGGAPAS